MVRSRRRVRAMLGRVEFTLGHDGFLRGKPEPELLFAVFAVAENAVSTLQVCQRKLQVTGAYPCVTELRNCLVVNARIPPNARRVALLGLALENDTGEDISEVQTQLGLAEGWKVRAGDSPLAAPFALGELSYLEPTPSPRGLAVSPSFDGKKLAETCLRDDFVGASLVLLDPDRGAGDVWMMRFTSENRRNDWTARLEVQL